MIVSHDKISNIYSLDIIINWTNEEKNKIKKIKKKYHTVKQFLNPIEKNHRFKQDGYHLIHLYMAAHFSVLVY